MRGTHALAILVLVGLTAVQGLKSEESEKDSRQFSLFTVVSFPNNECEGTGLTGGTRNGTCFTSTECTDKGGNSAGNCGAGFGVCCVFLLTSEGGQVRQNNTYIRNPSYPSAYTETRALTYTINKVDSSVCQIRLDFETFVSLGPADTNEQSGGTCRDSLSVMVSSGQTIPAVCGTLTGQHMYLDVGSQGSDTATLTFTPMGTDNSRTFEIKTTQIPCISRNKAPDGCLQYYATLQGRISTFNFDATTNAVHLANQLYTICIRQEMGYCGVRYQTCRDVATSATGETQAYSLSYSKAGAAAASDDALLDHNCDHDSVEIPGSQSCADGSRTLHSRYCGRHLLGYGLAAADFNGPVCDFTAPFQVNVFTNGFPDTSNAIAAMNNAILSRGLCLDFNQVPCNPTN